MKGVILILGLPRSGTTYLEHQLLEFNGMVAVGEVQQTVRACLGLKPKKTIRSIVRRKSYWTQSDYSNVLKKIENNKFWSEVKELLAEKQVNTIEDGVRIAYQHAASVYSESYVIDTSKNIDHFHTVKNIDSVRGKLIPVLVVRDYRGWLSSIKKYNAKYKIGRGGELVESMRWLYANYKMLWSVSRDKHKVVYYDSLVLRKDSLNDFYSGGCTVQPYYKDGYSKKNEMMGSDTYFSKSETFYDSSWILKKNGLIKSMLIDILCLRLLNKIKVQHDKNFK